MCERFTRIYNSWSGEKKKVIYFALGGIYYCPYCRNNHDVKYKE